MRLTIKEYIINNFKGDSGKEIFTAISESVKEDDELTLPGLGVFFSIVWQNASEGLKDEMIRIIELNMKRD